jgi:hypothetical protein
MIMALAALIGWITNNEALKRIIPTAVPMSPTVAVCVMTLGICLFTYAGSGATEWVRRGLCAAVLLVAASKLLDLWGGTHFAIDQYFLAVQMEASDPFYKNPTAPTTATNLMLLSLGLLAVSFQARPAAQVAGGAAALIALSALAGYVTGLRILIDPTGYYPMAVNSAVATLILGLGMIVRARITL